MSNGVFNSGDLATAASRRIPAHTNTVDSDNGSNNNSKIAASSAASPLYAKFRKSSSPLMNKETFAASGTAPSGTGVTASNGAHYQQPLIESTASSAGNPAPASAIKSGPVSFLNIDSRSTSALADAKQIQSGQSDLHVKAVQPVQNGATSPPTRDSDRKRRNIPSLTIKNGDDPFYRPNFEYSPTKDVLSSSPSGTTQQNLPAVSYKGDSSKFNTIPRSGGTTDAPATRGRVKSTSTSMGSRILSVFRSNGHDQSQPIREHEDLVGNVNLATKTAAADTKRAGGEDSKRLKDPNTPQKGKPAALSAAQIFPSPDSTRSFSTARDETTSEVGHGAGIQVQTESISRSSIIGGVSYGDKPAKPEDVLRRTSNPVVPLKTPSIVIQDGRKVSDGPDGLPAGGADSSTGKDIYKRPGGGGDAYSGRVPDARQSLFSIRSETSTIATTYKEGKDDADESDVDTTVSTLGPLVTGSFPHNMRNLPSSAASSHPHATKSAWDRERERKASAHSTSSDSSAAAVFSPAPPMPSIPSRILATGLTPAQANNRAANAIFRQAVYQASRPHTGDSFVSAVSNIGNGRPVSRDTAHDAMSAADEQSRPNTGISLASFEDAISESGHAGDVKAHGGLHENKLPSSVLPHRKQVIQSPQPTSRSAKRTSKAMSDAPSVLSQQSAATTGTVRDGGPRKTLASLYLVAGLPKDPTNWSLVENDSDGIGSGEPAHMENAVPRWFKAEVLGSMVSGGGEAALDALEGFQGRHANGNPKLKGVKKGKHIHAKSAMTTIEEQPTLSKEEVAKIQAKAIKLSLPRDVEIIAAGTAPPATSHTFSFTIKASATNQAATGSIKGALGASWDLALAQSARPASTDRDDTTYYGASLIVWTHADKTRTEAIRAAIETGSKARSLAIARAAKAAAAGRHFGEKLARQQARQVGGGKGRSGTPGNVTSGGETEVETEVYLESEWEGRGSAPLNASATALPFFKSATFWLPYALTLVSKYPIYDLLTDTLRLSWARYHLNIARHSMTMRKLLEFPAPRPSERFKIPVDPLADAEGAFVMRFPGKVSLNSITADIDFQLWPVLRCLDADNLLRIAEIALSPFGRIVFFCQHVYMLNLAIETFRHLLEPRGWKGIVHGVVHTRDIKVYMEDPGPFLIGIDSRCIALAKEKIDPEICYVDLETNDVRCERPPPGSLFKGAQRDRLVKKLAEAVGNVGHYGVPVELTDAFPGSRFRPFSVVEVNGRVAPAERLLPPSNWNYNQDRILTTFDAVISIRPNTNVLQRILHLRNSVRKAAELSTNAQHVQQIVRNQSNNFVDKRDLMEAKLWRMNKRLALLMQESQSWNSQFTHFQGFTEKLNLEASELRTKLEKERREAKRLSGVVSESKHAQEVLSSKLAQAESAHQQAMDQMQKIEEFKENLQKQRDEMYKEMEILANAALDQEMMDEIAMRLEMKSETWSSMTGRSKSPAISMTGGSSGGSTLHQQRKASMRSLKAANLLANGSGSNGMNGKANARIRKASNASNVTSAPTLTGLPEEGEDEDDIRTEGVNEESRDDEEMNDEEEEEYLEAAMMRRMAVTEAMRSIQEKLQTALLAAQARSRSTGPASPSPSPVPSTSASYKNVANTQVNGGTNSNVMHSASRNQVESPTISISSSSVDDGEMPGSLVTTNRPRIPRKSKSRTVVGHPSGTAVISRRVEVPSSASESELEENEDRNRNGSRVSSDRRRD